MLLAQALAAFKADVAQCDNLIANAHQDGPGGTPFLPEMDRRQITVAAFLNVFIAWESFLETTLAALMVGEPTISGTHPVRYVVPRDLQAAKALVKGVMKYFDYANHENFKQTVRMYFENGYPYEPHLSGLIGDLVDLKAMRNASAHLSTTTQNALEGAAMRIFARPRLGVTLYDLLTSIDPRSPNGETVFLAYKNKLVVAAELMANG